MEAKLCIAVCVLALAVLAIAQVQHIPTFTMDTPGSSTCPSEDHMDGIRADISNKISDVLAEETVCGGRGWRRVAFLDMKDPNQTCPDQWRLHEQDSLRLCGRRLYRSFACDSVKFDIGGRVYSQVCGRLIGYQYGSPDGAGHVVYSPTPGNGINEPYLDGVSITYGRPRKHIWSFFGHWNGYGCCSSIHINNTQFLGFIGDNAFCDTGNVDNVAWQDTLFVNHSLWDGVGGCTYSYTCCHSKSGPWFQTALAAPAVSDIEVRICTDQHSINEDTPLELVEIYVK